MGDCVCSEVLSWAAWLSPFLFLYWIFSEKQHKKTSPYSNPGWYFRLKRLWAYIAISRIKAQRQERVAKLRAAQKNHNIPPSHYEEELEKPRQLVKQDHIDSMLLWAADFKGNSLIVRFTRMRHCEARVAVQLTLKDGSVYQLPQSPDTFVTTTSRGWSANGLQLEVIEPNIKWRVLYNGLLRKGQRRELSEEPVEELHHVRFSFIWSACSAPYNCRYDWSTGLLADTLAREPWRSDDWIYTIKSHVGGYDQWGTMLGQVSGLLENDEKLTLHLRGLRQRRWGSNEAGRLHRRLALSGVLRNGAMFSIGADCEPDELSHATYGHVLSTDGHLHPIDWTSLSLPDLAETPDDIPRQFVVTFKAGNHKYSAAFYLPGGGCLLYVGRPWNYQMLLEPMECALDSKPGVGLAELCYRYNGPCPLDKRHNIQFIREPAIQSTSQLLVDFSDRECRSSAIVGGKGASLAALSSLEKKEFSIPSGFCLTIEAFKRQLADNPSLIAAIDAVFNIASTRQPGDLQEECDKAVKLFEETPVCERVSTEIKSALEALKDERRWAVRSSAVGEDSEDLSAAGQNATILGCRDAQDIISAVSRCWASLYSYQSVSYRRQNGQQIKAEMGVVVQEMVDAETAGVMFTRDPTNGDPRRILITSNFGLGESVVSASIEPDTVIVRPGKPFVITEKTCGKKGHKIVMDDKGTVEEKLGEEADRLSLEDEQAITLAQIGKSLESSFGGPRDIEWAFSKGTLYLLQARPITSLYPWSDFELRHERDSPLITDNEVLTRGNTGEVLPGACTTLMESVNIRHLDYAIGQGFYTNEPPHYYNKNLVINCSQAFLNVVNVFLKRNNGTISSELLVNDIAVFGHPVVDDTLLKAGVERFGAMGPIESLSYLGNLVKESWYAAATTEESVRISEAFSLQEGESISNADSLLKYITDNFPTLDKVIENHCAVSRVSSIGQVFVMSTLVEGKLEITTEHRADMATLMKVTATGTVSSEVPQFIAKTTTDVLALEDVDSFCNTTPEKALTWLQKNSPEISRKLQAFIKRHGHRILKEFDFYAVTYDMNCLPLIEIIQSLVKAKKNGDVPAQSANTTQSEKSIKEAVDSLKTPEKRVTRRVLRFLLPWYQNAVKRREIVKAELIRVVHEFRLAFHNLGRLMVQEGYLPDQKLIHFLTIWELGELIKTRNPNLLKKAVRRQRLYTQWDALQFPEFCFGYPKPQKDEDNIPLGDGVGLVATSACPGVVKAKAFVVHRHQGPEALKDATSGDILITHSTDIGWSPYFPMLGGVVTELGGLISHGAVVAREYGLPCIIGAQNATRIFETGDLVILNGDTGEIRKVTTDGPSDK